MTIDNATFYSLAITVFFLSLILIILLISYFQTHKRLRVLQKEHNRTKDYWDQKTARAAKEAQKKANELINNAAKKAEEIINNSKIVSANLEKTLDKNLEGLAKKQIETFRKNMENKTLQSDNRLEERIEKAYEETKMELEIKKREKLKKLDGEIFKIVNLAVKNIIGKTLSLQDQEDLVFKALDQAKKDRII